MQTVQWDADLDDPTSIPFMGDTLEAAVHALCAAPHTQRWRPLVDKAGRFPQPPLPALQLVDDGRNCGYYTLTGFRLEAVPEIPDAYVVRWIG